MGLFSKIRQMLGLPIEVPVNLNINTENKLSLKNTQSTINLNTKNPNTMSMFNYGVGGSEVKVDANEAINEIQENKTLLVAKLTHEEPVNPEITAGLKTVDDVFNYFKPSVSVDQETPDGQIISENFRFGTLGDFSPKSITQQSPYLKNMNLQQEQYNKIVRQLKSNKVLKSMLDDEQAKYVFIEALKVVAQELETTN